MIGTLVRWHPTGRFDHPSSPHSLTIHRLQITAALGLGASERKYASAAGDRARALTDPTPPCAGD